MNRRVEIAKLEDGYLVRAWCKTAPEAYAVQCVAQSVPPPRAYQPNSGTEQPNSGIPFDDPEEPAWPSDARATWYNGPINCDGHNAEAVLAENSAGAVLAQGQFEAAVDGDECTGAACLITRGAND